MSMLLPFLNAFVATTFDLDSYETYAILSTLLLAMLPATLHWVARTAFCMSFWSSGLAASLVLFNITYHRWSFQGQLTFISGLLFLTPRGWGRGCRLREKGACRVRRPFPLDAPRCLSCPVPLCPCSPYLLWMPPSLAENPLASGPRSDAPESPRPLDRDQPGDDVLSGCLWHLRCRSDARELA